MERAHLIVKYASAQPCQLHLTQSVLRHQLRKIEERISTECYTAYHWLPSILKVFNRKSPNVDVQVVGEATAHPIEVLNTILVPAGVTPKPVSLMQLTEGIIEMVKAGLGIAVLAN